MRNRLLFCLPHWTWNSVQMPACKASDPQWISFMRSGRLAYAHGRSSWFSHPLTPHQVQSSICAGARNQKKLKRKKSRADFQKKRISILLKAASRIWTAILILRKIYTWKVQSKSGLWCEIKRSEKWPGEIRKLRLIEQDEKTSVKMTIKMLERLYRQADGSALTVQLKIRAYF